MRRTSQNAQAQGMMEGVADVSTGEAAAQLGLSVRTLQHWAKHGLIEPAGKTPGGRYRWDVDDLRRQLRENLSISVTSRSPR